jgi:RsiW-degrading membrane proteinase PrsW (M82 family)
MYHSIRSLFLRKRSREVYLPRFWIFLLCYLAILGLGYWLSQNADVNAPLFTGLLIYLGGIFPALTILALGIGRLRFPKMSEQLTSWRRFTLALVSGATLSVLLASILELLVGIILLGSQSTNIFQALSLSNTSNSSPLYSILVITAVVVAPIVEELVKPLAVVVLIGRVRSKAEAFALGLACGVGFSLVETVGYISQGGSSDWLSVALGRSGVSLLHGFGAAMMALGWYILTHREEGSWGRRIGLGLGCALYAIVQHALWNGSIGLALLPGPLGTFFTTWSWSLGPLTIDGSELVNIIEVIGILIFFIVLAGRLRRKPAHSPVEGGNAQVSG